MSPKNEGAEPELIPDTNSPDEPEFRGGLRPGSPGEVKYRRLPTGSVEYVLPEQCRLYSGVYSGPRTRRLPDGTVEYIPGDE